MRLCRCGLCMFLCCCINFEVLNGHYRGYSFYPLYYVNIITLCQWQGCSLYACLAYSVMSFRGPITIFPPCPLVLCNAAKRTRKCVHNVEAMH